MHLECIILVKTSTSTSRRGVELRDPCPLHAVSFPVFYKRQPGANHFAGVVVFSPQIIENFRRSSAEGLSVLFVFVWLVGDVFNIFGAVLQGVLPTMVCT